MSLAFWRDVSLVWLSLFCFIGLVIPLVALYFAVRGIHLAHRQLALLLQRTQGYSRTMRQQSDRLSQQVAAPVIRAQGQAARWRALVRRLRLG